ncbi:hypothetical protein [Tenacibaculum jejuense]|uniref:Uncharacterized protein n=1 Tax=Tenacibaculum jejuense TaxID=584609 RepID=A0A238UAE2_9FLAO|nr:hypothetical protein [Tenacibaculum jejuense]SNR15370.1 protein of unknown function [Tenacibaculum jejuense]
MQLKKIHTEIANKWIEIRGISNELKNVLHDFEGDNLVGYVYIDHTAGITLDVIKIFDIKNDQLVFRESPADKGTRIISRFHGIINSKKISVLSEESINELNLKAPEYLSVYERFDLEEFRLNNRIHKFRAEGYPDDVQILLLPNNPFQPELVWGRVEKLEKDYLTCNILNQPNQNIGINENDLVKATVKTLNENEYIVCVIESNSESNLYKTNNRSWWKFW